MTGKTVDAIIDEILRAEGEQFTNDPKDAGGPTKWGVTQKALSEYLGRPASIDDVRNLSRETARSVYLERYFIRPKFNLILDVSPRIAAEVVDTGVNMGPEVAAKLLQRWLTAFNDEGSAYPDLVVDGRIGPGTQAALRAYLQRRGDLGERVLLCALNCSQGHRYLEITEGRPANERFLYGWMRARVLEQLA